VKVCALAESFLTDPGGLASAADGVAEEVETVVIAAEDATSGHIDEESGGIEGCGQLPDAVEVQCHCLSSGGSALFRDSRYRRCFGGGALCGLVFSVSERSAIGPGYLSHVDYVAKYSVHCLGRNEDARNIGIQNHEAFLVDLRLLGVRVRLQSAKEVRTVLREQIVGFVRSFFLHRVVVRSVLLFVR
jgi:hypothetical protein